MDLNHRSPPPFSSLRATLCLLAALLLAGGAARAEPAGGSGAEHRQHRTAEKEGGAAAEHQHPAEPGKLQPGVGLEEKLGEHVPLDLTFTGEDGRRVRLKELLTGPAIIAPVYYHCPNVCTFLQAGLARSLPDVRMTPGEDYSVISLSFDPGETPELARSSEKTYMAAMEGNYPEEAWHFLTGDQGAIDRLLEAAGYRVQPQGEDWLHPVAIFVVSQDGKIVRYLHGTSFLPMDLTLALMEATSGTVGTTIRKMVTFCFSYDPENKTYVFNILRVSAVVVLGTAGAFLAFLVVTGRKRSSGRENR